MIASEQPNIYLDLESISTTNHGHSRNTELIPEVRRLVAENHQLLWRVRRLEKACAGQRVSNLAIERNISCLFNTAVMEISRRDEEIFRLREKLTSQARNLEDTTVLANYN
ncbi:predicted protein [Micromonas commoda]|uniref:Uncharacterized protein n=1 Tax=Micromonas commoda (strain RCC299 / NOUM17 / CCMP2709) TaxID=296587 RepID=C1FEN3_MICCC|nr:predicted protein [Micromonas commoda]ACO68988.1 predicted protein [Micromonas commoda]|eukprot:XP_002507730.1 predicted protein [Micromonas commoda]